jgi:Mlc titration factor MtfA (ptsG expression regulator)
LKWLDQIQRWRKQHLLRNGRISPDLWERSVGDVLEHYRLNQRELGRLRELASLFLHNKSITGAGGLVVDASMRVDIAAQACLLVLNLDLDYFEGWSEVIVYPDTFMVTREERDPAGVIHESRRALGGEAWSHGPVILSWADARSGSHPHGPGSNVILHEFAHKLDMLNGAANGMPPLHADMVRENWTAALSGAYESLYLQIERHHHTEVDPYAAESPAEFFAVFSEVFFEQPVGLQQWYPDVYEQLRLFYRQDPLRRLCDR